MTFPGLPTGPGPLPGLPTGEYARAQAQGAAGEHRMPSAKELEGLEDARRVRRLARRLRFLRFLRRIR